MTFKIDTFTAVRLLSLNVRTENHGDGLARAVDLKCLGTFPNAKLDEISPGLLDLLYKAAEGEANAQAALEGVEQILKPLLKSHALKMPIGLDGEFTGYQLTVDRGLGGSSNLVLHEVSLNKVAVNCKEGGSIEVGFRLQCSNVGDEVVGRLSSYIKTDMHIALKPPAMKQEQLAASAPAPAPKAAAPKAAPAPKPTGHEAGDTLAANEAAGLNKDAKDVPKAPKRKPKAGEVGSAQRPSLKVVDKVPEKAA